MKRRLEDQVAKTPSSTSSSKSIDPAVAGVGGNSYLIGGRVSPIPMSSRPHPHASTSARSLSGGGIQACSAYVPSQNMKSSSDLNVVVHQAPFPQSVQAAYSTPNLSLKMHGGPSTSPSAMNSGGIITCPTSQPHQFQRLKVEDALTYLDSVKMKFSNQPQVYNDFLDIMKEFKSQSIDTPGVIKRVSTLFGEHPDLIVGFNTFLPPGYKIEVRSNDTGFQVQVSMPSPSSSTTTMAPAITQIHHTTTVMPGGLSLQMPNPAVASTSNVIAVSTTSTAGPKSMIIGNPNVIGQSQMSPVSSTSVPAPVLSGVQQPPLTTSHSHYSHLSAAITNILPLPPLTSNQSAIPAVGHMDSTTTLSISGSPMSPGVSVTPTPLVTSSCISTSCVSSSSAITPVPLPQQNQPVEFNHAINYVNKIKNRFQGQPDKYKKFLEILHTYQKEQKNYKEVGKQLTEAEVYSQVAKLFENQDDLLAEFGQFLPDATNHHTNIVNYKVNNEHQSIARSKPPVSLKLNPTVPPFNSGNGSSSSSSPGPPPSAPSPTDGVTPPAVSIPAVTTPTPAAAVKYGNGSSSSNLAIVNPLGSTSISNQAPVIQGSNCAAGLKRSPSFSNVSSSTSAISHHQGSASPTAITTATTPPYLHHHTQPPPTKKHKPSSSVISQPSSSYRDVTTAEAARYGSLTDFAFFDQIRNAIKSPAVYENFLRCLVLYNQEIINRSELLVLTAPFFVRYGELFKFFKDYVGASDAVSSDGSSPPSQQSSSNHGISFDMSLLNPNNGLASRQDRPIYQPTLQVGEHSNDVDYSTCKRLGASYCALPKNFVQPSCSGRTALCREVLNDTWVSFPSWSEDSTFVSSRKNTFEDQIYRCEDERFELELVIEVNAAAIRTLEGVSKKMCRLTSDELAKFRLDDCLGGSSPTINIRAIDRIYGDKSPDIIEGVKKNPAAAVPVVLKRLKAKDEEWREAQKSFNKIWREVNEKYYLKSIDHQGLVFKPNDLKALRSKSLFQDIEAIFDEMHEQAEETGQPHIGPHLILDYKDKSVLDDAANLLIHHVKRQSGIHKEDKQRIKQLLRQFIPNLFHHPKQELSEDERDELEDNMDLDDPSSPLPDSEKVLSGSSFSGKSNSDDAVDGIKNEDESEEDVKVPLHAMNKLPDEYYTLLFGNNTWYFFMRYHHILCERLLKIFECANRIAQEEAMYSKNRSESVSIALRLKPQLSIEVEDYYPAFLDMVKNVLDGNMELNTYEDTLREMFGIHAYVAFTLDKVVSYAVRQLHRLVSDRPSQECIEIFLRESRRGGAGGSCITASQRSHLEAGYQRKIETALTEESCFKMFIYKHECKLTIELLDTEGDDNERHEGAEKWTNFVDDYVDPENKDEGLDNDEDSVLFSKPLFLPRNIRCYKETRPSAGTSNQLRMDDEGHPMYKMKYSEDTECRFNLNSCQTLFVMGKDFYLSRYNALQNARKSHINVSRAMSEKFRKWHSEWCKDNVTKSQSEEAIRWMMGHSNDSIPNITEVIRDNSLDKPPYRIYNYYKVTRL